MTAVSNHTHITTATSFTAVDLNRTPSHNNRHFVEAITILTVI